MALVSAPPWPLVWVTAERRLVRSEVNMNSILVISRWIPRHTYIRIHGMYVQPAGIDVVCYMQQKPMICYDCSEWHGASHALHRTPGLSFTQPAQPIEVST